jgi:hypothetical protein
MAKDPAERFPDAKSVLTELKRIEASGELNQTSFDTNQKPLRWWSGLPISGRTLRTYAIGCLVVFLLAAGMGRERRRPNPLDSEPAAPRVPLQQTAAAQVAIARTLASGPTRDNRATEEEAWRLVIDQFPDVTAAVLEARLELGLLQLSQRRYEQSQSQFTVLTQQNNNAWRARGISGLAVLETLTGKYADSHERIATERDNLIRDLDESRLQRLINEADRLNRRHRGSTDTEFKGLFELQDPAAD